ncbi:hypothetical protein Tco_0508419 [Tanacetum coccineum]
MPREHTTEKPDRHDPNAQDNTKQRKNYYFHKFTTNFYYGKVVAEKLSLEIDDMLRIRLRKAGSDEEIFTSVAWIRAFNINEQIYAELCHEFYSTYEFDEVGYQAVELEKEGFNVYFEGGLRNYDNFNTQDYWLSISREDNLGLSKSHTSTIRNPVLRLLSMFHARHQNGYANVAWMIAKWMKRVLTEDVVRSLITLIYCRDLDTITLRDLIDSEGKLIPKDPQPSVPRVGIPRPTRASMQDLYDRMGRMEIRQDAMNGWSIGSHITRTVLSAVPASATTVSAAAG